jgi:Kef-type K+ transport system membrane component KefB
MFWLLSDTENVSLLLTLYENKIFILGIMVLLALVGGKLIERLNFPKVTGYIVMGILIGPSLSSLIFSEEVIVWINEHLGIEYEGLISSHMVHAFQIIRQVAIGFIGYTIGLELKLRKLKKTGKQVTVITMVQALMTAVLVCLAVISYLGIIGGSNTLTYGLILGAIATATAPAPIVAVVKNYRTKGPVTDVLLPLVALDDAIGIMLFATMLSLGTTLLGVSGTLTTFEIIYEPLKEIVLSIVLGGLIGIVLSYVVKKFNRESDAMLLMMIIAAVFVGIGIGQAVHASAILLPMTIGVVLTNSVEESFEHRLTRTTDLFIAPIMLSFFMIAGLELDLTTIPVVLGMGGIYIVVRVIGKIVGAYSSAKFMKAPPTVTKYLGFTLIPQAGVAIDMAITANARFEEIVGFEHIGAEIMTIVLAATVFYEVIGLVIVKTALHKAGEIDAVDVGWNSGH